VKSHDGLAGSLGRRRGCVKRRVPVGCRICKSDARGGGKAKNFTQRAQKSAEYAQRTKIPRRKQAERSGKKQRGARGAADSHSAKGIRKERIGLNVDGNWARSGAVAGGGLSLPAWAQITACISTSYAA
jgi:hypothetical protein